MLQTNAPTTSALLGVFTDIDISSPEDFSDTSNFLFGVPTDIDAFSLGIFGDSFLFYNDTSIFGDNSLYNVSSPEVLRDNFLLEAPPDVFSPISFLGVPSSPKCSMSPLLIKDVETQQKPEEFRLLPQPNYEYVSAQPIHTPALKNPFCISEATFNVFASNNNPNKFVSEKIRFNESCEKNGIDSYALLPSEIVKNLPSNVKAVISKNKFYLNYFCKEIKIGIVDLRQRKDKIIDSFISMVDACSKAKKNCCSKIPKNVFMRLQRMVRKIQSDGEYKKTVEYESASPNRKRRRLF